MGNTSLMEETRWGEEWNIGDRVRYGHPDPGRTDFVEGAIKDKSWGREKGKPIYLFLVRADGEETDWVIGPDRLQAITDEPLPVPPRRPQAAKAMPDAVTTDETGSKYPVPPPEDSGFSPLDSDNWKEWRRDKRRWEAAQQHGGTGTA